MQLNTLDYAIIVAYFAVVLVLGLLCSGRAGRSMVDFFASGRQLPWWIAGTSMVATTFAADTPLAVTALVLEQGVAGNWFWWAFAISGSVTVFLFAKLWRRSEVLTDVELIELRYGGPPAAFLRGFRAIYVATIVNSVIIAWVTGAMLTIVQQTLPAGWVSQVGDWTVIIMLLGLVGIYSTMSGLWGVALADMLQFVLAMTGCTALAVLAVKHVGGIADLQQQVHQLAGPETLSFLPRFEATNTGLPWHVFVLLVGVQWWATWFPGAEPGGGGYVVQRMSSCRDERHAVWATLWFQIAHYCLRPWPWILVALVALVLHPELLAADAKKEVGYVLVMKEIAPHGLRGLLLAAFFAAYMSTISTQMNWGASYLVRDVYQRFWAPEASETRLVAASRGASILILVAGAVASYVFRDKSIPDLWRMLAALGAGTGLVFMARWMWWRITAWTEISAMLFSLLFFMLGTAQQQRLSEWFGFELGETHLMGLLAVCTLAASFTVTLLLPAESPATLEAFYRRVRPPRGGWQPIADRLPQVRSDGNFLLGTLMAALAVALIYTTLPAIGYWIFGQWQRAAALSAIAAVLAVAVGYGTARIVGQAGEEPAETTAD